MRVLFTCIVGYGHFYPLVPLARELCQAGHEIAFATDPWFCPHVAEAGFEVFPAGLSQPEAYARFRAANPAYDKAPPAEQWRMLFAGLNGRVRVPPMLASLGPIIAAWQPQLLIHDAGELAGPIAAQAAGIPAATHSLGILRPSVMTASAAEVVGSIVRELGQPEISAEGRPGLYIDICPPSFQVPQISAVANVRELRPVGLHSALPAWIAGLPSRPTIYITMGTVFNQAVPIFEVILDGLRHEALNLVVTVGKDLDPAALGQTGPDVHVERFIAQAPLLAHCDLLIAHGGSGATLGALCAGLPVLAIPQGSDQFHNAERIVQTGVGLQLLPGEFGARAVRDAVRTLLEDDRFATRSQAIRHEIEQMPLPSTLVPVLEALISR